MRSMSSTNEIMFILLFMVVTTQCVHSASSAWNITFNPAEPTVLIGETKTVEFNLTGPFDANKKYLLSVEAGNRNVLSVSYDGEAPTADCTGRFNITGVFLGKSGVTVRIRDTTAKAAVGEFRTMVKVLRPQRAVDKVFTVSVAVLVSLIYVNFGCALNWADVSATLRRPVGPSIGLASQFLFMPLASYGLALLLFPDDANMQLGMFFTGVAPGGGASNMWTVLLGGNLDLSITMTAVSTLAAFAMMPLWLFTLGRSIFRTGDIPVPYAQISTYAVALLVPLLVGYLMQRYFEAAARFLARMLKGFASALLVFIVAFAIATNFYLFRLFSWQLIVSGLGLPWLGYAFAWAFAKYASRQSAKDSLTIAIETGIQNTGIAIFLLRFTLPQPEADITTIAPVSVAMMTPIPLLALYIIQKVRNRRAAQEPPDLKQPDNENQSYQTMIE